VFVYFQNVSGMARNDTGQTFNTVSRYTSASITISQESGEPPLTHCSSRSFNPSSDYSMVVMLVSVRPMSSSDRVCSGRVGNRTMIAGKTLRSEE
jgi:hypothetical protein